MTQVIAHRGASVAERENTVAAFRRAVELGADAIELDVRRTADGRLVVHHDAVVDGDDPAHPPRPVCDTPAGELPGHVPLLADALDACDGVWVNIEIKNDPHEPGHDPTDAIADAVAHELGGRPPSTRWLVSSFRWETVVRFAGVAPHVGVALLTLAADEALLDRVAEVRMRAIHPWDHAVTPELVRAARARGLGVNVWTVDDPLRIAELVAWGVDGICTNVPDVAAGVRSRVRRG